MLPRSCRIRYLLQFPDGRTARRAVRAAWPSSTWPPCHQIILPDW